MHPILCQLGPLTLRTYGALVAVAFILGLRFMEWGGRTRKIPDAFMVDFAAVLILSGLLGARLLYVLLNFNYFREHTFEMIKIWEGGLVFYGGFLAATVAGIWYSKYRGYRPAEVADCVAPALAVAQAIGRWGCFFAGCCYGKPTAVSWSVKFKDSASLAPLGIDLHPVQLYESFGCLLIGLFLWVRLSQKKDEEGQVFWFYVLLYGLLRFVMEMLRGDDRGGSLGGATPSQIVAVLAIVIAGSILVAQKSSGSSAGSHGGVS